MIGAIAQGTRLEKSKLRFHIQDFSFSNVSVVRGKEVWRLTGAHEIEKSRKPNILDIKILKLLKRLVHGEEKNEKLFEIVEEIYKTEKKENDYEAMECLAVLRILSTLGYIRNNDKIKTFLESTTFDEDLIGQIKKDKKDIVKVINSALAESQL